MCYIMIAKRLNNSRNPKVEQQLREIALSKAVTNSDGFFIDYAGASIRTMDKEEAKKTLNRIPFDNTLMHFRFATTGKKDVSNVHGWELNGFQFLHNGMASGLGQKEDNNPDTLTQMDKDEEEYFNRKYGNPQFDLPSEKKKALMLADADSKILFKKIVKKIEEFGNSDKKIVKAIKYVVNNCWFWGRAVLIDKAHDKAYLFGDWHVYLVAESYVVYSSAKLDDTLEYERSIHGIGFRVKENQLTNAVENTFDGIAIIKNFTKPNFHFKLWNTPLEDKSMDERPTVTTYTPTISSKFPTNKQLHFDDMEYDPDGRVEDVVINEYNEGKLPYSIEDETNDLIDAIDLIEDYRIMNPFDMLVYTDETGTHDEANICCDNDMCWIYDSFAYKEYKKEQTLQNVYGQGLFPGAKTENETILEV